MSNDIRKGDLIKATHKKVPETTVLDRVTDIGAGYVYTNEFCLYRPRFDFEVLERPIDEELLKQAGKVYSDAMGYNEGYDGELFRTGAKAVIEFVRAYDKEHAR